ncbi:LPXTG cell wall anchor domain-containing protein [Glycomyces sp. NPDC047369]
MNRTLKRVLGLAGSAVLGLAGAVTFASAAQAHHVEIEGTTECTPDGGWTVVWQVNDWNSTDLGAGVITAVTLDGEFNEGTEIVEGAELPHPTTGDYLEGSVNFPADQTEASITIEAEWPNGATGSGTSTLTAPAGGCEEEEPEQPEPSYEYGGFYECTSVYAWAENYNEEALAEFTFVSSDGEEISGTPEVGDWIDYTFFVQDYEAGLSVDIYVGDELVDTITWEPNDLCAYISVESDCDSLTFTLTSPEDGEPAYFELWTNLTEDSWSFDLAPGESETVEIPGEEGLQVYYYISTQKDEITGEVRWTPCPPEETPSESPTPKPELPKTGSSLTIMIGSAAALIVAAGVIFFLMRRRRAAQDW